MSNSGLQRVGVLRWLAAGALTAAVLGTLGGCVVLAGGAVAGSTMVAMDRRSSGTQLDDQAIELRVAVVIDENIGQRGHVNATSYNRVVLLTGEVPTEADRSKIETLITKVDNVRLVLNELAVMPNTTLSQRANDTIITGKVKAAIFDAKELQVVSVKVVTERGVVYLMGRLTEVESMTAAQVARGVGGVQRVVKVFEIISPAEAAAMLVPPPSAASAPAK
jgi:osmotically-inducible protein OsmY